MKHYIWNQSKSGWLMVRVLVVDGEQLIRNVLTQWLQSWGYDAVAVAGTDEALEHMRVSPADIVIADIMMPEQDGLWLLDQMREHWPHTLVIMESRADDLETVLRTRQRGVFDYVPKPLGHETLREALERARGAILPPAGQVPTSPPPGNGGPPAKS